jgi:hypothetical protein
MRNPKDLAIQQELLRNGMVTQSPDLGRQYENMIMARYRAEVEDYHEARGTRHVTVHSPKAAQIKYELPYYRESRRLEDKVAWLLGTKPPSKTRNFLLAFKIAAYAAWIRIKGWMKIYMPLSYENFQLAKI